MSKKTTTNEVIENRPGVYTTSYAPEYKEREKTKEIQKEALAEYAGRAILYAVGGAITGIVLVATLAGLDAIFPSLKSTTSYTAQTLLAVTGLMAVVGLIIGLGTTD